MKIYGRLSLTYLLTHPLTHLLIQHRYSHENNDNIIYQTNTWKDLMLENVTFSLVKEKIVTIGYSVCVQPQLASIIKGRDMEYISSRYTTLSLTHSLTHSLTYSLTLSESFLMGSHSVMGQAPLVLELTILRLVY